jgi:sporulation protein YunB
VTGKRFRATRNQATSLRLPSKLIPILIFIFLIGIIIHLMDVKLRPTVTAAAKAVATRAAVEALNQALTEELAKSVSYKQLIEVERNKDGDLKSARFNFAAVTKLQSEATSRAEDNLHALEDQTLKLPVAPVLGDSLFANVAPKIPIRITLIGSAHSSVSPEVKSVGINQTVHILYVDLSAEVNVVAPLVSAPVTVHSRVPIAYIVLSGEVPNAVWTPQVFG